VALILCDKGHCPHRPEHSAGYLLRLEQSDGNERDRRWRRAPAAQGAPPPAARCPDAPRTCGTGAPGPAHGLVARSRAPPNIARKLPHPTCAVNTCATMPRARGYRMRPAHWAADSIRSNDGHCALSKRYTQRPIARFRRRAIPDESTPDCDMPDRANSCHRPEWRLPAK
jgi:hypothetical protein